MTNKYFGDIRYDSDWWRQSYEGYLAGEDRPRTEVRSEQIRKSGYQYTSCHGRVKTDPVVFQSGSGPILFDADGSAYLDFSSGIYVTNLGHAHPKISEAVARAARELMNCHDYMTPVKAAYMERLADALGQDLSYIHLYDNGTTAVEFAMRAARAITGKHEILTCFSDHHGKTLGSASLGRISSVVGSTRAPGFYLVPRPDPYRPLWKKGDGTIDTDAYLSFYDLFIKETTTGNLAAFLLEPIQGWGGTIIPPVDFFPKLAVWCKDKGMLLITDEILTGSGRTGKWLCADHWDVRPDITLLGKGIGNGFPMSAMITRKEYASAIDKIAPSTTFGGSPMACAAGLATLEVMEEEGVLENAHKIGSLMLEILRDIKDRHPIVGDVRGIGGLLGIEFVKDRVTKEPFGQASELVYKECMKRKFLPGIPVVHLIRIAPPLNISEDVVRHGMQVLEECIAEVEKRL